MMKSGGLGALAEKTRKAHEGFKRYAADFASLVAAETKLGLNETLGLTGALRAAVHDIEIEAQGDRRAAAHQLNADDAPA